ncbi:MAG TPA: crossover junction endodeoxyribonuclease RuvC, partial [Kofleriaceae bacterium]|nr:crossover junction endodeoxyribonuclease RuvC [Kofleriaceae bacterium]
MRVLGVDPGSRVCGYAAIAVGSARAIEYLECGVLTAAPREPAERRLAEIARSLAEVVGEVRPDQIAVEDVFHHINARSALALA